MAKTSKIARNDYREKMVAKYADRRAELKKVLSDPDATLEAKFEARDALNAQPRDASATRYRKRGAVTGRPRAHLGYFGLDRVNFRRKALRGELPGVRKASW